MLSYVIPGGILLNAVGFKLDVFASTDPEFGWFSFGGDVSGAFFAAWAAVVGFLVVGDLMQKR